MSKSAYVNLLSPIAAFWRKTTDDIKQEYETVPRGRKVVENRISERKRADYKLLGRDEYQLDRVLRFCKFHEQHYSFYPRNFEWAPALGYAELLIHEMAVRLQKLPELTLSNIGDLFLRKQSFTIPLNEEREEEIKVLFEDGGCSCMHVYKPKSILKLHDPRTPVICFFPSLTENQDGFIDVRKYCTDVKNWYVVVFNRRGLCELLTTPQFWICGNDTDTRTMFAELHKKSYIKDRPMFAIGWSMGAAQLTRYIGKYNTPEDRKFDGLLAAGNISGPFHPRDVKMSDEKMWKETLGFFIKRCYINREVNEFGDTYMNLWNNYDLDDVTKSHLLNEEEQQEHLDQMAKYQAVYKNMDRSHSIYELMYLHYHLNREFTNNDILEFVKQEIAGLPEERRREIEQKSLVQLIDENSEYVFNYFSDQHASTYGSQIKIPYVAICAADDFLIKWHPKSVNIMLESDYVTLILTKAGNHCLFQGSDVDTGGTSWASGVIFDYFEEITKQLQPVGNLFEQQ